MHLFFLVLPAVQGMCAGWCSPALCSSVWKCMACPMCLSPPSPPAPPQPPPDPSAPWLAADLAPSELDRHDYARALQLSLLFYRAQRSGDLSGTGNPIPYRTAPSFLADGSDVGVDLSKGYFDAGDYVKYVQPATYAMTMLAWGGLEFGSGMRAAGEAAELRSAVRWGADFLLASAVHLEHNCTFHAQVGRGATQHCDAPGCKFDHGFWGRPEDYPRYRFAHQRRTATIDATRPATEAFAGAAAALASAHLLLRGGGEGGGEGEGGADALYADRLLSVSRRLYACAVGTNPSGARLTTALPEAYPQYQSRSVGDELAWAAVWLADATGEHGRYLGAVRGHLGVGGNALTYEGFGVSWDDVNAAAKLKFITLGWPGHADAEFMYGQVRVQQAEIEGGPGHRRRYRIYSRRHCFLTAAAPGESSRPLNSHGAHGLSTPVEPTASQLPWSPRTPVEPTASRLPSPSGRTLPAQVARLRSMAAAHHALWPLLAAKVVAAQVCRRLLSAGRHLRQALSDRPPRAAAHALGLWAATLCARR